MAGLGALIIFLLWAPLSLSQGIQGGWEPADKNSKAVQDIAVFCVSQYNKNSDGNNLAKMISLEDASQQVVAGMNYDLTIVLVQTQCKKNSKNSPSCEKPSSKCHIERCVCSVYDVPYEKKRTLSSLKCTVL
ncbi:cystatin-SN-like [Rana temporaria]|uniref:cystatin-SN-like n=1 Tax=Rana temporaria TaxID=8407 RepID=UPI001AAD8F66|nr:cystatin-SN-like [Rana temporaria]